MKINKKKMQKNNLSKRMTKRISMVVSMVVIFTTTYSMILPAIAIDNTQAAAEPGMDIGQQTYVSQLACQYTPHVHTDACYIEKDVLDANGNPTGQREKELICGKADFVVHEHDASCYDEYGNLVCTLPELPWHVHSKEEGCYETRRVLNCTIPEHVHTDACYTEVTTGYDRVLTCGYNEGDIISPAIYTEAVYSDPVYNDAGELVEEAQLVEEPRLVQAEVVHYHTDTCYEEVPITERQLTCGMEEHVHSDACYKDEDVLICTKPEVHTHIEQCYEYGPNGESPIDMGWAWYEEENGQMILNGDPAHRTCGKTEVLQHVHDDSCFRQIPQETVYDEYTGEEYYNEAADQLAEVQDAEEGLTEEETAAADSAADDAEEAGGAKTVELENNKEKTEVEAESEVNADEENAEAVEGSSEEKDAEEADAEKAEDADKDKEDKETDDADKDADKEKTEEAAMPAADFHESTETVEVTVTAVEGTFPEGTTMVVTDVVDEDILSSIRNASSGDENSIVKVQAADITFYDKDGNSVEPKKPVKVVMVPIVKQNEEINENAAVEVIHVDDEGEATVVEQAATAENLISEVAFRAESFSVYALVYTVDFEYSVNGKMYQFSLSGGEKIALSELIEVLGILDGTNFADTDAFLKEVKGVEFSDPALVKVTQMEGDWELESLEPFTTEESLTITMKNGDVITVKVTDDQESDGVWDLANTSNTQYLHVSADSTVTQNEQERDAAFKLTFTYSLTEDVVHAIDAYNGTPILKYDLNSLIADSPIGDIRNNVNGVISIGSRKLGTYTIVDGVVTLKFTDISYFDGRSTFTGYFNITAQTNETELGTNDEYTYSFPGTTDVIPIHYKKTVEEGKKSVNSTKNNDGSYTLHYSADINVNSDLDSMTFNDTLGGLQSLDASSVKINGTAVSVTQSGQSFSFDVASALGTTGVAKGSYKVTYDTKVTEEQLKAMSDDKTTETNTASWKVNGNKDVPGGSTTIEIDKPREPIPVTKTVDKSAAQPGDTVTYTVTYGKDTTELSGFHISDYITDVVIPQGDVTLTYNGQTTHVNFDAQASDSSYSKGTVTLFDYTFPEGTPGNGPVTATYTVKLIDADTAKTNGIYDATEVSNTAQEHRQNTTDTKKTTVTYEKEPVYTVVKSESSTKREDGKWDPDTIINYTLTIGDAATNMAGVNIRDVMTDLQVLQGDVMIKVGNGSQMKLSDYVSGAIKWSDDGKYSTNDVELFNFNMPSNAGNGPVVITYSTKVISQTQATSSDVFGEKQIKNTGSGGKQSDSTDNTGVFDPYPINKQVTKENADVNHQTVEMGGTVHYTLTYGEAGMNLAGAVIEDQMTDLQKLVSAITVTKADGRSFTMPTGTGQWSEDGNNWDFWDDGKYSTGKICLFKYKLPADIGEGPITIEYDTQIITEAEANESGIHGDQSAFNDFRDKHDTVETEVKIEFPKQVTHNPQVRKEFDHWDVENSKVYWNIIVEKDADSAYPLENVTVQEAWDQSHVSITEGNQGFYGYNQFNGTYFDITNAVVTTDDGTVLTPGVDYTIDKSTTKFTFPVLNERVHINLAFLSPAKIIDGYYMSNEVRLNNGKTGSADQTYNKPEVEAVKNGKYNEDSRIVTWEVQINPKAKQFNISDANKYVLLFEDYIPEGLTILNYDNNSESNPSVHVAFGWRNYNAPITAEVQADGTTKVTGNIHPKYVTWDEQQHNSDVSLSGEKVVVTYKTKLSDAEWDRITSSASGSETFQNNVTITAGDNEKFDATDKVTVTSDGYITKTDTTKDDGGIVYEMIGDEKTNSKNITYSIEINPHGYALNNGNTLSLTDYIATNMDLDTTSVSISNATLGDDGKLHAGDTAPVDIEVSYNDDSRLLSIREIPDRTPLLLTYTCIARAQGQDTFTNTATLVGGGSHSASTHETHTIQTNDAGVAIDGIEMFIYKIDENNISKDLNGAQF